MSAPTFDLAVVGGRLIDPAAGLDGRYDVGFAGGRVAAVAPTIDRASCAEVVDASGMLVVPGLVDAHVHVYPGVSHYGVEADAHCLAHGATTVVDAGSAGADTFGGLRRYVIERSRTRILARVNISTMGMISRRIGELASIAWADADRTVEVLRENPDVVLGVKVRLTRELVDAGAGLRPLHIAREAADRAGVPLMVHPQESWARSIDDVVDLLRAGDILTHAYHGLEHGILDAHGRVRESVLRARERGVVFDLGHGEGSFGWSVAESALADGFLPSMISTDLHRYNVPEPVHSLPHVMSKFLALGVPLGDVVAMATAQPARVIGREGALGTLAVGAVADAAVLEIGSQEVDLVDSYGVRRRGSTVLACRAVVRDGVRVDRDDLLKGHTS